MSRRARLLRKHRRIIRDIEREEAICGRVLWMWRQLTMMHLRNRKQNVRSQRWR